MGDYVCGACAPFSCSGNTIITLHIHACACLFPVAWPRQAFLPFRFVSPARFSDGACATCKRKTPRDKRCQIDFHKHALTTSPPEKKVNSGLSAPNAFSFQ